MTTRGIRGAITASDNHPEAILSATQTLLKEILEANPALETDAIASVLFAVTPDLNAVYPAQAARELGWHHIPLLCFQDIPVPGGLPRCIRILIHWNTPLPAEQIRHVYLGAAAILRPDLARTASNGLHPSRRRSSSKLGAGLDGLDRHLDEFPDRR